MDDVVAVVDTVSVVVTVALPDGVTDAGLNVQLALLGNVPQENLIVPL